MQPVARLRVRPVVAERRAHARTRRANQGSPVVKWAGGKTRLMDEILRRRPPTFRRYFEPFLGGAAVFFRMAPANSVLSDCNEDLINMYRCVAWHVEGVIRRLRTHKEKHCEEHYYATRSRWNGRTGRQADVDRAAMFIYLNKTCYNGLWRVNRKGLFNVPIGRYTDPTICDADALRLASKALQRAELRNGDYRFVEEAASSGDFVYFDPPYQPASTTANFTSYTADSFGEDNQRELARIARNLANAGCAVMLSNSDTPFIRDLYDGFDIASVRCVRAINSRASSRGAVGEVIVTAGY